MKSKFVRSSGILMHISSLPDPYGIGSFGNCAYEFVDFLVDAKQRYWQILPVGITGFGDSPYQSYAAFAGNPFFISIEQLIKEKLLKSSEVRKRPSTDVDYDLVKAEKFAILHKAFKRFADSDLIKSEAYKTYLASNAFWLEDFALFMAIKYSEHDKPWYDWQPKLRNRDPKTLKAFQKNFGDEIAFWKFTQYVFYKQYGALKTYANDKGVEIIGDLPIYVSRDSVEAWAKPELFVTDVHHDPKFVAGCPPDYFSETGQLWGNPIYDWEKMKEDGYAWWILRLRESMKLFDVIRIDHFRGFEAYWSIPAGEETAINGEWVKGPGYDLFKVVKKELKGIKIIAEDLGMITPEVHKLIAKTGFPGMKILQFAFDTENESSYLPHNFSHSNYIVYTGTHDNDTITGFLDHAPKKVQKFAKHYLNLTKKEGYNWGLIRGAWSSTAVIAIAQMQDFLDVSSHGRMNIPSTIGANWKWRIKEASLDPELSKRIKEMTILYSRGK